MGETYLVDVVFPTVTLRFSGSLRGVMSRISRLLAVGLAFASVYADTGAPALLPAASAQEPAASPSLGGAPAVPREAAPREVAPEATSPSGPSSTGPSSTGLSLSGKWRAEPMTVRWVIGNWSEACGPRPQGGGDNGGEVSVEQRGDELVIAGEGSSFTTAQCFQMHAALEPRAHTRNGNVWKTTCRTDASEPRQEILQTSVSATADTISLQESGQYQFMANGQTCAASSGRWRTYRRVVAAAAPEPRRPANNPCATPGAPARIEVRPSRKLMRAGESFSFRASVYDAQGCSLGTPVAWSLDPEGAEASIQGGRLSIAQGAADAELTVTATAASQSVRASVDVVSTDRYAALLASGDFDADGASSDAATATITAGSLGARQGTDGEAPSDRKWTFVGLVSAIALVFALIGAWLLRRGRRAGRRPPARGRALPDTGTVVFAGDDTLGELPQRLDRTRLESVQAPVMPAAKPGMVCPVCGTMYEGRSQRMCPKDGAQLLPINA